MVGKIKAKTISNGKHKSHFDLAEWEEGADSILLLAVWFFFLKPYVIYFHWKLRYERHH